MNRILFCLLFLVITTINANASVITYTFDSLTPDTYYTEAQFNNQFSGVYFDNTKSDGFVAWEWTGGGDFLYGIAMVNHIYDTPGSSTIALFSKPVNYMAISMGQVAEAEYDIWLKGYDNSGNLISSDSYVLPSLFGSSHVLSISSDYFDIEWVEFGGNGYKNNAVLWDNFSYEPVPIPSAVWLLGSGLIGIWKFRRKRI